MDVKPNRNLMSATSLQNQSRAREACIRLCIDMVYGVDMRDYDRAVETFTHDAVLIAPRKTVNGHDGIRSWLNERPADAFTRHICSNFRIDFEDARTASGFSYILCFRTQATPDVAFPVPTPLPLMAEYHDRFCLTDEGWRIARREIRLLFTPS